MGMTKLKIETLPENAVLSAEQVQEVLEIVIEEEKGVAVYCVKGKKRAKLFFIIPLSVKVEQMINIETGELVSTRKSWWSFLADE